MKKITLLFVLFLFAALSFAQEETEKSIPQNFTASLKVNSFGIRGKPFLHVKDTFYFGLQRYQKMPMEMISMQNPISTF
jgi:hypothetical protein